MAKSDYAKRRPASAGATPSPPSLAVDVSHTITDARIKTTKNTLKTTIASILTSTTEVIKIINTLLELPSVKENQQITQTLDKLLNGDTKTETTTDDFKITGLMSINGLLITEGKKLSSAIEQDISGIQGNILSCEHTIFESINKLYSCLSEELVRLGGLATQHLETQQEVTNLKQQLTDLQATKTDCDEQVEKLQEENATLRTAQVNLTRKKEELEKEIDTLQAENNTLRAQALTTTTSTDRLTTDNDDLKQQLTDLRTTKTDNDVQMKKLQEENDAKLKALKKTVDDLQAENRTLRTAQGNLTRKKEELEKTITILQAENSQPKTPATVGTEYSDKSLRTFITAQTSELQAANKLLHKQLNDLSQNLSEVIDILTKPKTPIAEVREDSSYPEIQFVTRPPRAMLENQELMNQLTDERRKAESTTGYSTTYAQPPYGIVINNNAGYPQYPAQDQDTSPRQQNTTFQKTMERLDKELESLLKQVKELEEKLPSSTDVTKQTAAPL